MQCNLDGIMQEVKRKSSMNDAAAPLRESFGYTEEKFSLFVRDLLLLWTIEVMTSETL